MKHHHIIFLFTVALLGAASGCKKGPEMPLQTLDTDKEAIIAPYSGAEYVLSVNSNTAWRVDLAQANWIAPSIEECTGSAELKLVLQPNSGDERSAILRLQSRDGLLSKEVGIVQSGVSSEGYISISALRMLEKEGESYKLSGNKEKIKGFVVSDAVSGNWFGNSVAIEDSFSKENSGITVEVSGEYDAFSPGEEISVSLDGATLGRNDEGYLVLKTGAHPEKTASTPLTVKPESISHAMLASGKYESMLVVLTDIQVVEESIGGTWNISPVFQNAEDERIKVAVSENAAFASSTYNEGAGKISGIGGFSSKIPELRPTKATDIDLSTMRIGVEPGIRSLPYVFPFYCRENTNGTPKYIQYTNHSYDASTRLAKVIARDKEESYGVFLEMVAYGSEASKIYGPNYWAEAGGHDNINCSGFVSLDNGKTTPSAECGFFLTVPVQMDMPSDINVSFGLCGAGDYTLSDWAVSWSADKKQWKESGRVRIERKTASGSYYFYYTVPVHFDVPFKEGSNLYLKITPQGSRSINGATTSDGHGNSCQLRFHSAIVLSHEQEGKTDIPANAVYFQPFDKLTAGMDYFIGERLAAFANYCSDEISAWSEEKKQGLSGSKVMERPGYAQIGYANTETPPGRSEYSNETGVLETPSLGKAGNLRLSFKAAAYRTPAIRPNAPSTTPDVGNPDITSAKIEILGGGTIDGQASVQVDGLPCDKFKTFTMEIENATPSTKIRFTSTPKEGEFSRWFIDDILVTE